MEHKERRKEDALAKLSRKISDQQIGHGVRELITDCLEAARKENEKLVAEIELIEDALINHVIDKCITVRSIVNALDDKDEIDGFSRKAPRGSKFHLRRGACLDLKGCLNYWKAKRVLSHQDSLPKALEILRDRMNNNLLFEEDMA